MRSNYRKLGDFIQQVDVRNKEGKVDRLLGLSINKYFMPSVANIIGTDISSYKIIRRNQFACSLMQVSRDEKIPIDCLSDYDIAVVSPAYHVFEIKNTEKILPQYLSMWFKRSEFDREGAFLGVGGIRGSMTWDDFCEMEFPIASLEKQKANVKAYQTITHRIALKRRINERLISFCCISYQNLLETYTTESKILPKGWSISHLGEYADIKSGFAFKSEWWCKDAYKVIKISNIVDNSIDLESCDCIISEYTDKASNFLVTSGDILIALIGATTGKIGLVPLTNEKIFVNQRVGKFFLGKNPINRVPFLLSTLLYEPVTRNIRPNGEMGSAQDNLSPDDIKNIKIVMPDMVTMENFNQRFSSIIINIIETGAEISKLNKFCNILLSRLAGERQW
jgi:type I restriction enzyme S subunit